MRAGGVTPATRWCPLRQVPGSLAAFNEGRGGYPGDAPSALLLAAAIGPFNEGRGGYPGDASPKTPTADKIKATVQ